MNLEDIVIEADARKVFGIKSVTTQAELNNLLKAMELIYQNNSTEIGIQRIARWTEEQYKELIGKHVLCEDFQIRVLANFISLKSVYRDEEDTDALLFGDGTYTLLDEDLRCHNGMQIIGSIDVYNTKYIPRQETTNSVYIPLSYFE